MRKNNLPRAKFFSAPFVAGYSDIEKENFHILIGNSEKDDNVFFDENIPKYISCHCVLVPKSEFRDIEISSNYKLDPESEEENSMNFRIYSGKNINMKGFISSVDIEIKDITRIDLESVIPKEWSNFIRENPKIFTKNFITQTNSMEIESYIDEEFEITDIAHFKSKAYFFAGSYYKGISIPEIQQYFFFIGSDAYGKEYINVISSKEILSSSSTCLVEGVKLETLSSLQDDIVDGKASISFPGEVTYKSVEIKKDTLTSDVCKIIFKKV